MLERLDQVARPPAPRGPRCPDRRAERAARIRSRSIGRARPAAPARCARSAGGPREYCTASRRDGRPPRARRHRHVPIRRSRRRDQHRAPHPAEPGRGGDSSRPRPVGRRNRDGRDPGRRECDRGLVVPGRPQRVLPLHARPAARARCAAHPGVCRRRWHDLARRGDRARGVRRGPDLHARGRSRARLAGHGRDNRRHVRRHRAEGADRRCRTLVAGRAAGDRACHQLARARRRRCEHGALGAAGPTATGGRTSARRCWD